MSSSQVSQPVPAFNQIFLWLGFLFLCSVYVFNDSLHSLELIPKFVFVNHLSRIPTPASYCSQVKTFWFKKISRPEFRTSHCSWMSIMYGMRWASQGENSCVLFFMLGCDRWRVERQVLWVWCGFSHFCLPGLPGLPGLKNKSRISHPTYKNKIIACCIKAVVQLQAEIFMLNEEVVFLKMCWMNCFWKRCNLLQPKFVVSSVRLQLLSFSLSTW